MDYLTRADDIIAIYVDIHREYTKTKTDSIYKQLTSRISYPMYKQDYYNQAFIAQRFHIQNV